MGGQWEFRDLLRENPTKWFDTKEVAKHLEVAPTAVNRLAKRLYDWQTEIDGKLVRALERRSIKVEFGNKFIYKATEAT